ncbi:MAG: ABC transporter ATP-binding protein [Vicinamibacterales bacterium]
MPELQSSVARLEGVQKSYGKTKALENVSMAVQAGQVLAVLGPNGAGKTTAIGLWLGLLRPDAGEVLVMGGSPLDVDRRRQVGVMMQDVALAPALTTREHILLAASYYQSAMSVEDALALTGTTALANTRYGKLSTGQKRQVQFAVAVVGRPKVLFLDEPTVGLDIEARTAMWRTIRCLVDDGCAIVLTTHYLEEAEALANRVVVMARGRVVAQGTVDEMRALVTRKRISCTSTLAVEEIRQWPGVVEATREDGVVHVTASEAEHVVRQLLAADGELTQLEVKKASLAEAFSEITREAA